MSSIIFHEKFTILLNFHYIYVKRHKKSPAENRALKQNAQTNYAAILRSRKEEKIK